MPSCGTGDRNWNRVVVKAAQRQLRRRRLGDTCTISPFTGQQVCSAGDPGQQVSQAICLDANKPQNMPTSGGLSADGSASQMILNGTTLTWIPSSKNKRTFEFMYHAGTSDVYRYVSGGKCTNFNCNYAIVSSTGYLSWASTPPAKEEPPCNVQSPLQPTNPTQGGANTCYTTQSGQVICGTSTVVYPSGNTTVWPTYGGTSNSPYVQTPAAIATQPEKDFSLSNLPPWAMVAGGAGAMFLVSKFMGGRR